MAKPSFNTIQCKNKKTLLGADNVEIPMSGGYVGDALKGKWFDQAWLKQKIISKFGKNYASGLSISVIGYTVYIEHALIGTFDSANNPMRFDVSKDPALIRFLKRKYHSVNIS